MKEIKINSKIIIQISETGSTKETTKVDIGTAILGLEQYLNSLPVLSSHKGLIAHLRFHFDTDKIEEQL
jgi:hypothetical protein